MKSLTISEGFVKAIDDRKVLRAFFSTYCFEPDFFELEVLPLLMGSPALSSNETIRYFQLQDLMHGMHHRFAVAYDFDVFNPGLPTRLEIDYLPIRVEGGCQHSKIVVLEVENSDGAVALILAAGSFNLTKAGWWENIEVGHWVELTNTSAPANIVTPLKRALNYFQQRQPSQVLVDLNLRLALFSESADDPTCSFYFSGSGGSRQHFSEFIHSKAPGNGPVEIVSPFFAEKGNDEVISDFLRSFKSVSLLLPQDDDQVALIDSNVYDGLSEARVAWCRWRPTLASEFEVPRKGNIPRTLHAKIYQCLGTKSWMFIGSVNLSRKAFRVNVEAGFFLTGVPCTPLLAKEEQAPDCFMPSLEAVPAQADETTPMPVVQIVYDWRTKIVEVTIGKTGDLTLLDSTGNALGCFSLEKDKAQCVRFEAIEEHLGRSSLIATTWQTGEGKEVARRMLLVSQRNVFCRPTYLPSMNLQDLLRIFQGMHPARRVELVAALAARLVRLQQDGATADQYLPSLPTAADRTNFFSEFSQVNGAFWTLKKHLSEAQQAGKRDTLDYYLKGCQPDSLRGVLDSLEPAEGQTLPSLIVRYLTLLSLHELLDLYSVDAGPGLLQTVGERIAATEQDAEFNNIHRKEQFLAFIKERFRMPVKELIQAKKTAGAPDAGN